MKKFLITMAILLFAGLGVFSGKVSAMPLYIMVTPSDGSDCSSILDGDYWTSQYFYPGTVLTIESDAPIKTLYIVWDQIPGEWQLTENDGVTVHGTEGLLHETVALTSPSNYVSITIPESGASIADLSIYSEDAAAEPVQNWKPQLEKADVLVVLPYDDSQFHLFSDTISQICAKGDYTLQAAYFTDYFQTEPWKNHAILDYLWGLGNQNAPHYGRFYDFYAESVEEAEAFFNHDECLRYAVELIRRYKPQVLITSKESVEGDQSVGFPYVSRLFQEAVNLSGNAEYYPESANMYGVWEVGKTSFIGRPGEISADEILKDVTPYKDSDEAARQQEEEKRQQEEADKQKQEKEQQQESREKETKPILKKDIETNKRAEVSLKYLIAIIAAIVIVYIITFIVIRYRKYQSKHRSSR